MYERDDKSVKHSLNGGKEKKIKKCKDKGFVKVITFHDENDKHLDHLDVAIPPDFLGGMLTVNFGSAPNGDMIVWLTDEKGNTVMAFDADRKKNFEGDFKNIQL